MYYDVVEYVLIFFFSSRRRHTRLQGDWSSDVCSSDLVGGTTRFVQRLHALDITTGAEKFGGPVVIQASVPGSGSGVQSGQIGRASCREKCRSRWSPYH